jgi:hypothetical protein
VRQSTRTRRASQLTAVGVAAALTVLLARGSAAGAFTAQTGDTGNRAEAATSFCVSPGPQDVTVANDAWTDQTAAGTAYGTTPALNVASGVNANRRAYLRFTLPSVPKHCELVSAQLRLRAGTPTGGRTIDVHLADPQQSPQWAAGTLMWGNQPAAVAPVAGSASRTTAGIQTWDVTAHAGVLYAGPNNGFVLKDRTEGQNGPFNQAYDEQSTAGGTPAVLRLTWG